MVGCRHTSGLPRTCVGCRVWAVTVEFLVV